MYSRWDVYVVGADRSGLRRVAKAGDPDVGDPAPKLTWSPDGKRLAFAATFSHPGGKYRWLDSELRTVDLASGAIARLTQHRRPDSNDDRPAWSPDGRFVAFVHYDGRGLGTSTVELVSLERRTITAVAPARVHLSEGDSGFRRPSEVVWAPDGRRLAFTDLDGTKMVRLPGKHIVRVGPPLGVLTPCSTEDVPTPVWSPDSRRLAFLFAPTYSACNLYVVSAGGGRLQAATHFPRLLARPQHPELVERRAPPRRHELPPRRRAPDGLAPRGPDPGRPTDDDTRCRRVGPRLLPHGATRVLAHERVCRPGRRAAFFGHREGRRAGPRADVGSRRAAPRVRPGRRALRPRRRGRRRADGGAA